MAASVLHVVSDQHGAFAQALCIPASSGRLSALTALTTHSWRGLRGNARRNQNSLQTIQFQYDSVSNPLVGLVACLPSAGRTEATS